MKKLLLIPFLFLGCSTLQGLHPPNPDLPWRGHWVEQKGNAPARYWHFRDDGTFKAVEISYDSIGGNKIFDIRTGAYYFDLEIYMLAYIQKYRDEQPRRPRRVTVNITFVGPRPVIERGTFELHGGNSALTLINDKGVKIRLERSWDEIKAIK